MHTEVLVWDERRYKMGGFYHMASSVGISQISLAADAHLKADGEI